MAKDEAANATRYRHVWWNYMSTTEWSCETHKVVCNLAAATPGSSW